MMRRCARVLVCAAALWQLLAASAGAGAPPRANVVVFVPDELRAESMSVFGGPAATPHYARLARDGTAFSHAFASYPVCTQSRTSFLTGRFTHSAGHRTLWHPLRYYEPNLLRYAKNASYDVLWYGKNDALDDLSFNSSVTQSGAADTGVAGGNAFAMSDPRYYSFIAAETSTPLAETSDFANTAKAVAALHARAAGAPPFFLYLPLLAPHPPYGCPSPYYDMYANASLPALRPAGLAGKPAFHERIRYFRNATKWPAGTLRRVQELYLGCVSYSDAAFGLLLSALDALGLYDSTAIFVLSDHGDYGGDYGLVEKWPSGLEDVLTRVPLLAKVPGGVAGQATAALVQHMDVMPTILDVMGVPARHAHHGVSLLPVLRGAAAPDMARAVFAEGGYSSSTPRSFEGDCADALRSLCDPAGIYYPKGVQEWHEKATVTSAAMVRTQTMKLIRRSDQLAADEGSELYDLARDPLELHNVYGNASYAPAAAELANLLLEWYIQTSDVVVEEQDGPYAPDELPRRMLPGNWSGPAWRGIRQRSR